MSATKSIALVAAAALLGACTQEPQQADDSNYDQVQRGVVVPCVRFADPSGGGSTCADWNSACDSIQDAIDSATDAMNSNGSLPYCEVWVKKGTFYVNSGNRNDYIALKQNVHLYGGFQGTEDDVSPEDTDRTARLSDPNYERTVLDGGDDASADCIGTPSDCVYTVLKPESNTIVESFTIQNGFNDAPGSGGAMKIESRNDITVNDCGFSDNYAATGGGGIYIIQSYDISFTSCDFYGNTTNGWGGAAYLYRDNDTYCDPSGGTPSWTDCPKFDGCTFSDNESDSYGGAVYAWGSSPYFTDCRFTGNSATGANVIGAGGSGYGYGGAISNDDYTSAPYEHSIVGLENGHLYGNSANDRGGALYLGSDGGAFTEVSVHLINCTLASNVAGTACAVYSDTNAVANITNSLLWNTSCISSNEISGSSSQTNNAHRAGGCTDCIQLDASTAPPGFKDLANGDLDLTYESACIDEANDSEDTTQDILGRSRQDVYTTTPNVIADIGAYEFQLLSNGDECSDGGQCTSGHCADGVCCSTACNGTCDRCDTSGDGTCTYIPANTDPLGECSGNCRVCDGAGACTNATVGTDPEDECGNCRICNSSAACENAPVNTDPEDECGTCGVCNVSANCENAQDRTDPEDECPTCQACYSGSCVNVGAGLDPVGDCGLCEYCDGSQNCVDVAQYEDPMHDCPTCQSCYSGSCVNTPDGSDPKHECTASDPSTCGLDGDCDGSGLCGYWDPGTVCSSQHCDPKGRSVYYEDLCNSSHVCVDGGFSSCVPYVCETDDCLTACDDDDDCGLGYTCNRSHQCE